jgi:acyl dehydratase
MTTALPAVSVGQELSPLRVAPISRSTLALFAGASGDVNPIHIDLDIARSAGLDDVFAHGMLSMAYLGRFLTDWMPQARLRRWRVRFSAITPVHAEPVCTGVVTAIDNGIATLDIAVRLADGTVTLSGTADVDVTSPLSERPS